MSATNLPAPSASTELALPTTDEWSDVDDGAYGHQPDARVNFPRLVSDMRPGGGWTDELTGEKRTELNFIWLAHTQSRAYWPNPFGTGDNVPVCRSADMLRPDPNSPDVQSDACSSCPHAQWGANNEPPECKTRFNVLIYDVDTEKFATVTFSGTAVKKVNRYLSGLKASLPPRPPMARITHVTLDEESRDGLRWLEPVFAAGELLPRAQVQPLIDLRDEFSKQWQEVVAEDLATGADVSSGDESDKADRVASSFGASYEPAPGEEPF